MTDDTKRALVKLPDGELFIIEYEAIWSANDRVIGTRITASAGPLAYRDLVGGGPATTREQYDQIDQWPDLTDDDVDWLQDLDQAGRLSYPIGVR